MPLVNSVAAGREFFPEPRRRRRPGPFAGGRRCDIPYRLLDRAAKA